MSLVARRLLYGGHVRRALDRYEGNCRGAAWKTTAPFPATDVRTRHAAAGGHHDFRMNAHPFLAMCSSLGAILRQMHVAPAKSGSHIPNASIINQPL